MSQEPTTLEKLAGLPWSYATNAANTVFSQFVYFGSVFVLFLDHLGLSKTEIGFVLALTPLAALIAPFVAPYTARIGYKRAFVLYYGGRKAVTVLLLLTPVILSAYGGRAAFWFVAGVAALFSLSRAVEETAYFPWLQEFVPNSVRGKYSATSNIFTAFTGFVSVWIAGLVIGNTSGLNGFMLLFAAGIVAGFVSVWACTFIPGGAPNPAEATGERNLWAALQDPDFRRYLLGLALITLGTVPLASFLPLYLQDLVGLDASAVVFIQMGTLLGTLSSSYGWGWAADRYGSKPVMLTGAVLLVAQPLLWWLLPRQMAWSLYPALGMAFLQGVANLGWGIGAARLLFVTIVPPEKKMDYMALYFFWAGIVSGGSQLLGGRVLDITQSIAGQWGPLVLDPYTPIFLVSLLMPLGSILLLRAIRADSSFSTSQFAGLFLRGNPFLAVGSLVRFHWARDEEDTVAVTERMGTIRSRLAVDELLESLADPRFNVRFEAILAMARMPADERLIGGLVKVLQGKTPALSVLAAWALGRMGDEQAHTALHAALNTSAYRSVQAHSARSLGTLGDHSAVPVLLARLNGEEDEGLQVAYASALGKLGAVEATGELLALLDRCEDEITRLEVALALARLVGNERHFVRLLRQLRAEPGTGAAQAVTALARRLNGEGSIDSPANALLLQSADAFAKNQMESGAAHLLAGIERVSPLAEPGAEEIRHFCTARLVGSQNPATEYLLLLLFVLAAGS
ncbi:MAG: HEAT repeat domain-containing protein [Caldilineaceae bacterium]|nr:HEAT repeat domain-containing protein [Caldilineaceae bacterium]